MADNASNNSGSNAGNSNSQQTTSPSNDSNQSMDAVDPTIARHLDIAIEAQDGKPDAATETKKEGTDQTGESEQSKNSTSGTSDDPSQQGAADKSKDPEITEAARKLAGAKDLTLKGQGPNGSDLIVKGGAERRFYEQRETARQQLRAEQEEHARTRAQIEELQREAESLRAASASFNGVDPRELAIGARIVQDLQRDPVGTLRKLLTETAAQGIDINDLGASIDTNAVMRRLDELAPKETATEKTDEQLTRDAQAEVDNFYRTFPDAKLHDPLLARVLQDHPSLSLREAYFELKNGFIEKGFDFNLSLEDNLKAMGQSDLNANSGEQQGNNQQTSDNQRKPMPQGRGSAGEGEFKLNDTSVASDDMDTGDIVKEAMREAGYNV